MSGKNNSHSASTTTSTPPETSSSNGLPVLNADRLKLLYSTMLQCRQLEPRASQRRSRNASPLALLVGCALNLEPEDFIVPGPYQAVAAFLQRTLHPHESAAGSRRSKRTKSSEEDFATLNLITGPTKESRLSVGLGVAVANKRQKNRSVTLAFVADQAMSVKMANEALSFAAAHKLPIVYIVENARSANGRGTKTHTQEVPTITVDGNDAVAVYRVSQESIRRAREGYGPAVIEARTLNSSQRSANSSESDPLGFMENYLKRKQLWSDNWKKKLSKNSRSSSRSRSR
jgi:TPP-dependent pyruvate/acetoin dehydrogenase alpha subunit